MTCFPFLFGLSSGIRIKVYTYKELKTASDNFSLNNKIGEGGFGSVYKGLLKDGKVAAIKVLSAESKQGVKEFLREINMISEIKHENLVKLYGCCVEGDHRILVYNYLENNGLAQTLLAGGHSDIYFDWRTRSRICIGVARGLACLHEEVQPHIVHRDIKASKILLDKDLTPKISDFGHPKLIPSYMIHVSTRVAGTIITLKETDPVASKPNQPGHNNDGEQGNIILNSTDRTESNQSDHQDIKASTNLGTISITLKETDPAPSKPNQPGHKNDGAQGNKILNSTDGAESNQSDHQDIKASPNLGTISVTLKEKDPAPSKPNQPGHNNDGAQGNKILNSTDGTESYQSDHQDMKASPNLGSISITLKETDPAPSKPNQPGHNNDGAQGEPTQSDHQDIKVSTKLGATGGGSTTESGSQPSFSWARAIGQTLGSFCNGRWLYMFDTSNKRN